MDICREKQFKVIVLGEAGVGKSSLIRRYTHGYFSSRTTTTVGVDRIPIDINIDNETLKFQVLDTAGCFGFRGLIKSYMNNIDAVIFVYDITDKESFACLPLWNTILKNTSKRDITKVLVGNKRDLNTQRQVQFKNAKNYADFEGMVNMEISVKEEESVDLVFQCVARELRLKRQINECRQSSKEKKKLSFFKTKTQSEDILEKQSSPKQFIRQLSLMVMGRKKESFASQRRESLIGYSKPVTERTDLRHETPTTPSMIRRYDIN